MQAKFRQPSNGTDRAAGGSAHVVDVSVGKQTGTAGDNRHDGLPEWLAGDGIDGDGALLLGRGLGLGRLLPSKVEHDARD